jgi:hypothetical protein
MIAGVAMVIMSTLAWTRVIVAARNAIYPLPPAQGVASHGVFHTLLHGLGTEPNPWGIEWADSWGARFAARVAPGVAYTSPAYFRLMRRTYLHLLFTEPRAVAGIYAAKLKKAVSFPFRLFGLNIFWVAGALILSLPWMARFAAPPAHPAVWALSGAAIFLALFMAQGVVGIPWAKHLYPSKMIVVLMTGLAADVAWRHALARFERNEPVGEETA